MILQPPGDGASHPTSWDVTEVGREAGGMRAVYSADCPSLVAGRCTRNNRNKACVGYVGETGVETTWGRAATADPFASRLLAQFQPGGKLFPPAWGFVCLPACICVLSAMSWPCLRCGPSARDTKPPLQLAALWPAQRAEARLDGAGRSSQAPGRPGVWEVCWATGPALTCC